MSRCARCGQERDLSPLAPAELLDVAIAALVAAGAAPTAELAMLGAMDAVARRVSGAEGRLQVAGWALAALVDARGGDVVDEARWRASVAELEGWLALPSGEGDR